MKSARSIFRRMLPGFVLGFLALVALSLLGDLRQMAALALTFDWRIYPLALLLTLFNYTLRFIKWHFYLRQTGAQSIAWPHSLRLFVAGFPLALTPGKAGEVLKAVWVKKASGLPVGRGIAVVMAERISDGLAVLLLSTLGVIAYPQYWPAFLFILAVLLGIIILSQVRPLALRLLEFGTKLPLLNRFTAVLREFYEGSFALFKPRATLLAVGLGMVSWLGEGIGFYLILVGLGLPSGIHLLGLAIFVLSFSIVIGAASTLPGGLGASEASIAGMLVLLGTGIQPAVASMATLLIRLATLWFGMSLGLLVWLFSFELLGLRRYEEETAFEGQSEPQTDQPAQV